MSLKEKIHIANTTIKYGEILSGKNMEHLGSIKFKDGFTISYLSLKVGCMKDTGIKIKAKKEIAKIQNKFNLALKGKLPYSPNCPTIFDANLLVKYYNLVLDGNFKQAAKNQWNMDTDTRDFINNSVFNFIENFYDGE